MRYTLGSMLLWLASSMGRLGFKLRGADVTDMVCFLSLMLTVEKQREALQRAFDVALEGECGPRNRPRSIYGEWMEVADGIKVNTVPPKESN